MNLLLILFIAVIVLAFVFGLTNGFIDGGGLVSTVITTRALEPLSALVLIAVCEMVGIFLLGKAVAETLTHQMVRIPTGAPALEVLGVLVCALAGALVWNTSMWRLAMPSSSSHALVGGLVGAMLAQYGLAGVQWPVFLRIFILLGLVPILAALMGYLFSKATYWLGEFLTPATRGLFRGLQVIALAGLGLVHGSNDGQKCMAMIALAVLAFGHGNPAQAGMTWPVMLISGGALAIGVVFGSQRVIRTLGKQLYRVEGLQGFCAQTSALVLVGASSLMGYPMSTTHIVSTSVLGSGVAVRPSQVRWDLAGEIGLVWLGTIPAAAALSASLVWASRWVGGLFPGGM